MPPQNGSYDPYYASPEDFDEYRRRLAEQQKLQPQAPVDDESGLLTAARWGLGGLSVLPPVHPGLAIARGVGAVGTAGLGAYDTYKAIERGDNKTAALNALLTAWGATSLGRMRGWKARQIEANKPPPPPSAGWGGGGSTTPVPFGPGGGGPVRPMPTGGTVTGPTGPPPRPPGWGGAGTGTPMPVGSGPGGPIRPMPRGGSITVPDSPPPSGLPPGWGGMGSGLGGGPVGSMPRGGSVPGRPATTLPLGWGRSGSGVPTPGPVRATPTGGSFPALEKAVAAAGSGKGAFTLAKELVEESPKFGFGGKTYELAFEDPLEHAAYLIAGGVKRGANDAKILKAVMDHTNLDEYTVRQFGTQVRNHIKELADALPAGKTAIKVTPGGPQLIERAVARQAAREAETGMTAAQRAAHHRAEEARRLAGQPQSGVLPQPNLGDITQLSQIVASYNLITKQVSNLVKEGKAVPEDILAQLSESTQLLAGAHGQLPKAAARTVSKSLGQGIAALALAHNVVPAATKAVIEGVEQATAASAKAAAAKTADPLVQRAVDTVTALGTKLGFTPDKSQQIVDALTKGTGKGGKLTPGQQKGLKDLSFSAAILLTQFGGAFGHEDVDGQSGQFTFDPDGSERDPQTWAFAGLAAGSLATAAGSSLKIPPATLKKMVDKIIDWNRFSLLSSPNAIGRANLGAVSSVFNLAAQRIAEGRYEDAARGLSYLGSQTAKGKWIKAAFGNPVDHLDDPAVRASFVSRAPASKGVTNWPGKAIAAGDVISTNAIMKMGYSHKDAMAANLSSEPKTALGKGLMRLMGESVKEEVKDRHGRVTGTRILKPDFDREKSPVAALLTSYVSPFTRTAVNTVEQGLRYSPAGPFMRETFGDTRKQANIKAALGTFGGFYAGKKIAENTSAELDPLLVAAGGPMSIPVFVGQTYQRAQERDLPWQTIAQKVSEEIPMIGEQFGLQDVPGRMVPSFLRDIAKAQDPAFERLKGPSEVREHIRSQGGPVDQIAESMATWTAGARYKIPGLRETLPERFVDVDNWGQPQFKTDRPAYLPDITLRGKVSGRPEIVLPKIMMSTPRQNPPDLGVNDPIAQAVKRVQDMVPERGAAVSQPMMPRFPEMENEMRMAGMTTQTMDRDTRLATLRAKGITAEKMIKQLVQSPGFHKMPPDQQHQLIRTVYEDASKESSGFVTPLIQTATQAPSTRAQVREMLNQYIQGMSAY